MALPLKELQKLHTVTVVAEQHPLNQFLFRIRLDWGSGKSEYPLAIYRGAENERRQSPRRLR